MPFQIGHKPIGGFKKGMKPTKGFTGKKHTVLSREMISIGLKEYYKRKHQDDEK